MADLLSAVEREGEAYPKRDESPRAWDRYRRSARPVVCVDWTPPAVRRISESIGSDPILGRDSSKKLDYPKAG
jgi:hypothetical protein